MSGGLGARLSKILEDPRLLENPEVIRDA